MIKIHVYATEAGLVNIMDGKEWVGWSSTDPPRRYSIHLEVPVSRILATFDNKLIHFKANPKEDGL